MKSEKDTTADAVDVRQIKELNETFYANREIQLKLTANIRNRIPEQSYDS